MDDSSPKTETQPQQDTHIADTKPKLYYYNARGRAEVLRLILAHCEVDYDDVRISSKDLTAEIRKLKSTIEVPFDQLPILVMDGFHLAQTVAILRYIGDRFGLGGDTQVATAKVQMITCAADDFMNKFINVITAYGTSRGQEVSEFLMTAAPRWATNFEKLLLKGKGDWYVDNKLSFADFAVYAVVSHIQGRIPGIFQTYEHLMRHATRIEALPNVDKWLSKRPDNNF